MIGVLDWMEFQVLAAARGVEAVYGFSEDSRSPGDSSGRMAAARYAVYQMVRDGILAEDRDGLKILQPFSRYMDIICASPQLVVIDRGGYGLPRQCIYHEPAAPARESEGSIAPACGAAEPDALTHEGVGPGAPACGVAEPEAFPPEGVGPIAPACGVAEPDAFPHEGADPVTSACEDAGQYTFVCLEESQVDEGKVCLSGMDWDMLCRQMEDLGQLPPPRLKEGIGAYDYEAYWRGHMPGAFWERLEAGCAVETDALLEEPLVHTIFSLRDMRTGELKERMLLLDSALEYCLLHQQPGRGAEPVPYSRKAVLERLKTWWRDGT